MIAEAERVADDMFRYPFQLAFCRGVRGPRVRAAGRRLARDAAGDRARRTCARRMAGIGAGAAGGDRGGRRGPGARLGRAGGRVRRACRATGCHPCRAGAVDAGWRTASHRPGSSPATRLRPRSPWRFPGRRGAIPTTPRRRSGERSRAVWAGGCSRRCATGGRWPTPSWRRPGRRRGAARCSPTSRRHPSGRSEARDEMLRELERFTREPVAEIELRQAVNYLAGQAEVGRQSGASVAGEMLEAWLAGAGLEEMEDPAAPFRAVTAEDVRRVAAASLDPARRAEGVVARHRSEPPAGGGELPLVRSRSRTSERSPRRRAPRLPAPGRRRPPGRSPPRASQ